MTDELQRRFLELLQEQKDRINTIFPKRNGLIVEYNEIITGLLGCNTNVSILGSDEQAKCTLLYLLKYVTKPSIAITHSLSLISHARRTIEKHPSVAEDTGTERRTAMHFLNRVVNKISGTVEISASFASLAILGKGSMF